jgi:hypothetical protein
MTKRHTRYDHHVIAGGGKNLLERHTASHVGHRDHIGRIGCQQRMDGARRLCQPRNAACAEAAPISPLK